MKKQNRRLTCPCSRYERRPRSACCDLFNLGDVTRCDTIYFNVNALHTPLEKITLEHDYTTRVSFSIVMKKANYMRVFQEIAPQIYLNNYQIKLNYHWDSKTISYYIFQNGFSQNKEELLNAIIKIRDTIWGMSSLSFNGYFREKLKKIIQDFNFYFGKSWVHSDNASWENIVYINQEFLIRRPVRVEIISESGQIKHTVSDDNFRKAINDADLNKVETYLRIFSASQFNELYSGAEFLYQAINLAINDLKHSNAYLRIIELLLLYGILSQTSEWLSIEKEILSMLYFSLDGSSTDNEIFEIIKLLRTVNTIPSLMIPKFEYSFDDTWQHEQDSEKSNRFVDFLINSNENIQKRLMPKKNYHDISVFTKDKSITTLFVAKQQIKLYAITLRTIDLDKEELSWLRGQVWDLFEKTFRLSDSNSTLWAYFQNELATIPLRFIDILLVNNKVCGFVIYQFFIFQEETAIVTHLRLAAVEPDISQEFPRIMTMLLTRAGFGVAQVFKNYTVGTFAEIISSSAILAFEVEGFESSLLYDEDNAVIPAIYNKIYNNSEKEQVDEKTNLFYHKRELLESEPEPTNLRRKTKNKTIANGIFSTRSDSVCKFFKRFQKPQHAMLYFFKNTPSNQNALANRVNLESGEQPAIDFATSNNEYGYGIGKMIAYQTFPKSMLDSSAPHKIYSRM